MTGSGADLAQRVLRDARFGHDDAGLIPCYTPGAMITTAYGKVDVADLQHGDLILTRDRGFQPVRWVCKTTLDHDRLAASPHLAPVLIRRDAFGPGLPSADMWVSPQHRMLFSGWKTQLRTDQSEVLVPALGLLNDHKIVQPMVTHATYVHLLFDAHEVIYANDTPSESLHAGQLDKGEITPAARAELFTLFPRLSDGYGATARQCLTVAQGQALVA